MEGSSQMNRRSVEQRVNLKGLHIAFDLSLLGAEHVQRFILLERGLTSVRPCSSVECRMQPKTPLRQLSGGNFQDGEHQARVRYTCNHNWPPRPRFVSFCQHILEQCIKDDKAEVSPRAKYDPRGGGQTKILNQAAGTGHIACMNAAMEHHPWERRDLAGLYDTLHGVTTGATRRVDTSLAGTMHVASPREFHILEQNLEVRGLQDQFSARVDRDQPRVHDVFRLHHSGIIKYHQANRKVLIVLPRRLISWRY